MISMLYPYEYVKNVFFIDYKKLYQKGYRGILFDIDNTLVHHGEDATKEVEELFQTIHQLGFQTILVSNNSEERILRFLKNIDSMYISDAQKPKKKGYQEAIHKLKIQKKEAIYIGDQVFTDILGANRSGITSILVAYMRYPGEQKIGIRRTLEQGLLKIYQWSRTYQHRIGNITKEEV